MTGTTTFRLYYYGGSAGPDPASTNAVFIDGPFGLQGPLGPSMDADIALTSTESTNAPVAGSGAGNLVHTFTATNNGPLDATGLQVTVGPGALPAGVSQDSAVPSAGTTYVGGVWNIGSLANTANATLTFTYTAGASAPNGGAITTSGSVTALDQIDPTSNNDSSSETSTVARSVDVSLSSTESGDPILAGSGVNNLTYVITAQNSGPSDAGNVSVSVAGPLPTGVTLVSATPSAGTWSMTYPGTWTLGTGAPGAMATLTLVYTVGPAAPAMADALGFSATATTTDPDSNGGNNTTSQLTSITRQSDLSISKVGPVGPVVAGTNMVYAISYSNGGVSDAANAVISDTLPAGTTYVSDTGGCMEAAGTLTCNLGTVPAGGGGNFEITVLVQPDVPDGADLTNTATITSDSPDPTPGNSSSTEVTGVIRNLDLAFNATESLDPVIAGSGMGNLVQTLEVSNGGPSDASNIVIDLTRRDCEDGSRVGVTLDGFVASVGTYNGAGTWTIPNLAPTDPPATLAFTCTVAANSPVADSVVGGRIRLRGELNSVDGTDTNAGNNNDIVRTTVDRLYDIAVTKTESIDPVIAGSGAGNLTYVVTATNNGPSDVTGAEFTEDLTIPGIGVTIDSVTPSNGVVGGTEPNYTWTVDIAAGGSETLTVVLTVASDAEEGDDVISNTATWVPGDQSACQTQPGGATDCGEETTPDNNTATEATTIMREIDLEWTSAESIDPVVAGSGMDNLIHTLTLVNNGPSDASGVAYDGETNAPLAFDCSIGTAPLGIEGGEIPQNIEIVEGTTVCSFSAPNETIPAGTGTVFTITMTVPSNAPVGTDTIVSSAQVTAANETDTNPDNDNTSVATSIERQIDLMVTKTDDPDPVVAGFEIGGLEYVVTVTNDGPSDGDAVVINDPTAQWPVGVVLESHVASAGTYDGTDWTVDLPAGATETLTMTVTVGPDTVPGDDAISNTAMVTGSGGMEIIINTGDDSATVLTTVDPTTASWTVSKDFLDDSGASVTATLACTSGEIINSPAQVSEGNDVVVTVERFLMGPFGTTDCEITESNLPPEYYQVSASEDCEVDGIVHEDEFNCDFVNAPIRANFTVTKDFSDDNPADVRVVIECNTGLPLMQEAMLSEFGNPFDSINFIVQNYEVGTLDCEIFEEPVPSGYAQSYEAAADDVDALFGSLGAEDDIGCFYDDIETGSYFCDVTNTLLPVDVTVNKEWIDENPGFNNPTLVEITFSCNAEILGICQTGTEGCPFAEGDIWVTEQYIDPDNPGLFQVLPHWDGSTVCSATEEPEAGVIQDQDDCAAIPLAPGVDGSCTITNTRFYEGIPTLSQYGLMLLSLLMLGMGAVAFRRYV